MAERMDGIHVRNAEIQTVDGKHSMPHVQEHELHHSNNVDTIDSKHNPADASMSDGKRSEDVGGNAPSDSVSPAKVKGSFSVAKSPLPVSVSVRDSPGLDAGNNSVTKPPGETHMPMPVEPFHQRGYAPGFRSRGHFAGSGPEVVGPHHRIFFEEDVVFKLLCQQEKVGSLIGRGGHVLRSIQNETGASIKVADVMPQTDERVVVISAREKSEQRHSQAQDAVMRVHTRLAEIGFEPSATVVARLLVHSQQIGCLLGRGGHIISEMRRGTGANIRVFPKEQTPKGSSPHDEVVQVVGHLHCVQDALFLITSRLRETIFPMRPPFPNNCPPYMPPFPEMPPPPFRPRHNPTSPSSYPSPVGPFHNIDRQPPLPHCMDPVSYPYGGERPGHGPAFDRPLSPICWTPQGDPRGMDAGSGFSSGNGPHGSGFHAPALTSTTVEVVIPQIYLPHVYGENNSNLGHIRQISGANVVVNDPKPGATEGVVVVSGTTDQTLAAQSLIQAFILSGLTF